MNEPLTEAILLAITFAVWAWIVLALVVVCLGLVAAVAMFRKWRRRAKDTAS